jgi:thiamine kinase-like enzyme
MDTNLANCLWAEGDMRFVDLEYSGWTDQFFDLAEQVEHGQSRGTPDAEWESFVDQFDLNREEQKRFFAAQCLMAFFWAMKYWPLKGMQASEPFRTQVGRIEQLCAS